MTKPRLQISRFNLGDSLNAMYVCVWAGIEEGTNECGVMMTFRGTFTAKAGLLNLGTIDIWGWITLCWGSLSSAL